MTRTIRTSESKYTRFVKNKRESWFASADQVRIMRIVKRETENKGTRVITHIYRIATQEVFGHKGKWSEQRILVAIMVMWALGDIGIKCNHGNKIIWWKGEYTKKFQKQRELAL